jgi:hypothetical protein
MVKREAGAWILRKMATTAGFYQMAGYHLRLGISEDDADKSLKYLHSYLLLMIDDGKN